MLSGDGDNLYEGKKSLIMPTSSYYHGQKDSPGTVIDDISEKHVFHESHYFKHFFIIFFYFINIYYITYLISYFCDFLNKFIHKH